MVLRLWFCCLDILNILYIRHNHRQRGFQFMGGGGNKVFLTLQHPFGRFKSPAQQEPADKENTYKSQKPDTAVCRGLPKCQCTYGRLLIKQNQ